MCPIGGWSIFKRTAALLPVLAGFAGAACGLSDVFASPGLKDVTLRYVGDSILYVGYPVAARFVVEGDGTLLVNPRLQLSVSDTAILKLTLSGDSLVPRKVGTATLSARLVSAILTDSVPALTQPLRVRGGSPP